ncbi:hypothetical protein GGI08_000207 [Coemansia sp. S2]|nr:hypothetical protein GGI08_000207 [Coemansia sp. S2]
MEGPLYTICVLGTFGISQAERNACPNRYSCRPPIKSLNSSDLLIAANKKRFHLDTAYKIRRQHRKWDDPVGWWLICTVFFFLTQDAMGFGSSLEDVTQATHWTYMTRLSNVTALRKRLWRNFYA